MESVMAWLNSFGCELWFKNMRVFATSSWKAEFTTWFSHTDLKLGADRDPSAFDKTSRNLGLRAWEWQNEPQPIDSRMDPDATLGCKCVPCALSPRSLGTVPNPLLSSECWPLEPTHQGSCWTQVVRWIQVDLRPLEVENHFRLGLLDHLPVWYPARQCCCGQCGRWRLLQNLSNSQRRHWHLSSFAGPLGRSGWWWSWSQLLLRAFTGHWISSWTLDPSWREALGGSHETLQHRPLILQLENHPSIACITSGEFSEPWNSVWLVDEKLEQHCQQAGRCFGNGLQWRYHLSWRRHAESYWTVGRAIVSCSLLRLVWPPKVKCSQLYSCVPCGQSTPLDWAPTWCASKLD